MAAVFSAALLLVAVACQLSAAADPLPSWNDGPAKSAIVAFVDRVTREGSPGFVRPEERIATFDNDGTLWCEQPNYVQVIFAVERLKSLATRHPEWRDEEPYAAMLKANPEQPLGGGLKAFEKLLMATHAGMSTTDFERIVSDWLAHARHPKFERPYTACIYQPMLEVLSFLRASGFKTFIVSGGGAEFMRPWTERAYGVPPEQVIGSTVKTEFKLIDGQPALMRLPEVDFVDDGLGKPVGIGKYIGRRPIAAFGNSDHDIPMLEWTTVADGPRLGMLVHHTDAEREYAYDRNSHVGQLDKGLDVAQARGWTLIDMRRDWKVVFPE
ncbi:MAG: haloacid dehalogenase-like hydrolase [Pirellulales bacterium]|nr:haloacid dehalogenase-like hydrolase [Pirellulales bacterium]